MTHETTTRPNVQNSQPSHYFPPHAQPPMVRPAVPDHSGHRGPAATAGFAQLFGLHPTLAFFVFVIDTMLFGGEIASAGVLLLLSFFTSGVLGFITFLIQKKWYGDDDTNALIKSLMVGLLTAIPTPLPAVLYLPAGAVGLFKKLTGK